MRWKCLIVDDDPVFCELVSAYCEQLPVFASIEIAPTAVQALKKVENGHFDLLFLDIKLPDVNGKDLLALLPPGLPVVMATADPEFAVESYNYNVVGYLVKPVTLPTFIKTIEKLKSRIAVPEHIFVKSGSHQVKIVLSDVQYIKSESNYVAFHLKEKRVMSWMRLSDLETRLPSSFIRLHRSFIVNTRYITSVAPNHVEIGPIRIPVSESSRDNLAEHLRSIS